MWLPIVIIGHLANAGAFVIDKYLLAKQVPNPVVYSYYIGVLGGLAIVLLPFGVYWPGLWQLMVAFFAGVTFIVALLFFFRALSMDNASTVVPFLGAVQPVFIFAFSFLFLTERLTENQIWAFVLLLLGGVIISYEKETKKNAKIHHLSLILALGAAFVFAVSSVLMKYVYLHQTFISGFFWSRLGAAIFAFSFLFFPSLRKKISAVSDKTRKSTRLLFIGNQVFGALGFVLLNYAISLASATLISALQGVQYVFLFLLVIFLSRWHPKILKEKLTGAIVAQKTVAILIIAAGLLFLTV